MNGVVVWFTGRPASGKSTLSAQVADALARRGVVAVTLDSDAVREAIAGAFGYDTEGRRSFYRALGRLAALLASQGHCVLVPATANLREYRSHARQAAPRFVEVYVSTSADECARRDPKGLYARAAADPTMSLPGRGAPFEEPESPDFETTVGGDPALAETIAAHVTSAQPN